MTDLYRIKPLVWEEAGPRQWIAHGGKWFTVWKAKSGWFETTANMKKHRTLEAAKSACEAHRLARLLEHLEPVEEK